jgi:hypothetical protein
MPPLQASENVSLPAVVGVTIVEPITACEPLHAPLAVQLVPLFDDQVTVAGCPTVTDAGLTFTETADGVKLVVLPP